jgi:putative Ca2+/H+ antiporter (TMEM165/GDT1 family)
MVIGYLSGPGVSMESFFVSTGIVTLAEMGDKTQLLSFLLAAKFRRPLPIILGILVATLLNHAGAAAIGDWLTSVIGNEALRWILGLSFLAMAGWMLIPDKLDDVDVRPVKFGVFGATVVAFFLAEMGDKTQVATMALAAKYAMFYPVVLGTTLGMMFANVPAVLLGNKITQAVPIRRVHAVAAVIFAVLGVLTLMNVGDFF